MTDDEIRAHLHTYEERLAQETTRRQQLQVALQQAQANVLQLEGACIGLRELLAVAAPVATSSSAAAEAA